MTSPYYHKVKDTQLYRRLLKEHSSKQDLLYLNFINDSSFTGQDSLFVDPSHMNRLWCREIHTPIDRLPKGQKTWQPRWTENGRQIRGIGAYNRNYFDGVL